MKLYLVQHGKAKTKDEDPERGLSDEGKDEVRRSAELFVRLDASPTRILSSRKKRAIETARIFAAAKGGDFSTEQLDDLAPKDDPALILERISTGATEAGELMIVGHLPHLSRLAALLITGDAEREVIAFRNAAVYCLEKNESGFWRLKWGLVPEMAS